MAAHGSTLLLHCDVSQSIYTLATHGAQWRQTFGSLRNAFQHASTLVEDTTSVEVYDELGKLLFTATVSPLKAFPPVNPPPRGMKIAPPPTEGPAATPN